VTSAPGSSALSGVASTDSALEALVAAFERGDYARVRREAPSLAASASSPDVRAAATALLGQTRPDPISSVFFALAAALLVFLSAYWLWRGGGPL